MVKAGFNRDAKVIGDILKNDPGVQAAILAAAQSIAQETGGTLDVFTTDRYVVSVNVPGERQARDGVLTKAVGSRGGTLSAHPR